VALRQYKRPAPLAPVFCIEIDVLVNNFYSLQELSTHLLFYFVLLIKYLNESCKMGSNPFFTLQEQYTLSLLFSREKIAGKVRKSLTSLQLLRPYFGQFLRYSSLQLR
jgi:hypothetical protein